MEINANRVQKKIFLRNLNPPYFSGSFVPSFFVNRICVLCRFLASSNGSQWTCAEQYFESDLFWLLRYQSQIPTPYIRQTALLNQALDFIEAISYTGASYTHDLPSEWLCQKLQESNQSDIDVNCSTRLDVLLRDLVIPIMNETAYHSGRPVIVETEILYACQSGLREEPDVKFSVVNTNQSTHSEGSELKVVYRVNITHECCCRNATEDCRAGYIKQHEQDMQREQCDMYQRLEFRVIGYLGIVITLLIWTAERRRTRGDGAPLLACDSFYKHPKFIFKDLFFMFAILSPINFMENRKGSIVVACMFGTLSALIFREIINPTGSQFVGATLWLFLLYPMFLCHSCSDKMAGSLCGSVYCTVFTFFMWMQLSCRSSAGQHDLAIYSLVPALCCNIFIGWFGYVLYERIKKARQRRRGRPRSATLSNLYNHQNMVTELLIPARVKQAEDDKANSTGQREPKWVTRALRATSQLLLGNILDWRRTYMYFKYSPRMLAMAAMSLCMLFNFVILLSFQMTHFIGWLERQLSNGFCCNGEACHHGDEYLWQQWSQNSTKLSLDEVRQNININYTDCSVNKALLDACYYTIMTAGVLMAILHALSVINMITVYRKHMMRFYRGDKTFLSKFIPGPYVALTDCLKYASYQVIFVVSGWMFSTLLLGLFFLLVAFLIILPAKGVYKDSFWPWVWSTYMFNSETGEVGVFLVTLLLYASLMGIVWFCFMDFKVTYAIQNRTLWDTFDLFQSIANFLVGIFMFIRRILTQILFGVLFISRLDKPLVPRGYEMFDPGFACYQGFLLIELYYSNPVMLTFIQLLSDTHLVSKKRRRQCNDGDLLHLGPDALLQSTRDTVLGELMILQWSHNSPASLVFPMRHGLCDPAFRFGVWWLFSTCVVSDNRRCRCCSLPDVVAPTEGNTMTARVKSRCAQDFLYFCVTENCGIKHACSES
eukprot:m.58859 g.58859  ORF g.58859 m.58859 type:complete len:943 (-) comp15657_c0_seq16:1812-4640(-)